MNLCTAFRNPAGRVSESFGKKLGFICLDTDLVFLIGEEKENSSDGEA